jgi:hypothetical protein
VRSPEARATIVDHRSFVASSAGCIDRMNLSVSSIQFECVVPRGYLSVPAGARMYPVATGPAEDVGVRLAGESIGLRGKRGRRCRVVSQSGRALRDFAARLLATATIHLQASTTRAILRAEARTNPDGTLFQESPMKFVSMMSAVALASVLAACGTAQKDAATAPGAVKGKSDCSTTCSDDAQIAPGAVGSKSDCGAKDDAQIAPGAVGGKSDCGAKDDVQIAPGAVGGKSDCGANDPLSID